MDLKANLYQLLKQKDFDTIIKECQKMIDSGNPNDVFRGEVYLAMSYTHQRKYEESKALFDKHFPQIKKQLGPVWNGKELIHAYLALSENEKALEYLDAYLARNPDKSDSQYHKANILIKAGKYEKALQILIELKEKHPKHAGVAYSSGLCLKELERHQESFDAFQEAYELGSDASMHEMFGLLFERQGTCDYLNCTSCCCHNQLLKGTDGQAIKQQADLDRLVLADKRNACWNKLAANEKGHWIFTCKHLQEDNSCSNYSERPQICHDYPANILNLKDACSYHFVLKDPPPKFHSTKALSIVLDILDAGIYQQEKERLMELNRGLLG